MTLFSSYKFRSINSSLLLCSHMWFNIRYICAWRCCYWLVFDIKWCVCVSPYGGFARCAKIYPALSYVWYIFFARVRQFSEFVSYVHILVMPALVICQLWWSGKYGSTVSIMPWQLLMLMCAQLKPKGPVVSSNTFTLNSCQLLMQEKENAA